MQNSDLRKIQMVSLEILKEFKKVCDKHHLTYYLAYGTLLGSIRHQGFIPWDDDIDIHMPIKDYLKFLEIAQDEFKEKYFLQSFNTDYGHPNIWSKIRKNGTLMVEKLTSHLDTHQGIFIDIFPLIPYPKEVKEQKKFNRTYLILKLLLEKNMTKEQRNKYYGPLGKKISIFTKIVPKNLTIKLENYLFKKLIKANYEYDQYTSGGDPFPKEPFAKTTLVSFEKEKFKAPYDYDQLLTYLYNEYMQLPPLDKQRNHAPIKVDFGDK